MYDENQIAKKREGGGDARSLLVFPGIHVLVRDDPLPALGDVF
jgi:hypothetical protein